MKPFMLAIVLSLVAASCHGGVSKRLTSIELSSPEDAQTIRARNSAGVQASSLQDSTKDICKVCKCNKQLITCPPEGFKNLSQVYIPSTFISLDLSSNDISTLSEDSLPLHPDSITDLDLSYNHIKFIAAYTFRNLKNLSRLKLSHNNLVTLEDKSLSGLENLERLDLSYNYFGIINVEYLANLPNLKYLILDSNPLNNLNGHIFKGNKRLTHLYLSKIGISNFDKEFFYYVRDLKVLHIGDNFLETVPSAALSLLPQLEYLNLDGNPIHVLGPYAFSPGLGNLQNIQLVSMYNLRQINIYAFTDLPMLRTVNIRDATNLIFIDPNAFNLNRTTPATYPHIKNVVIRSTLLKTLSKDLLNWGAVADVDISDNPFHCNCNLTWTIDFVKQHEVNNKTRCASPPSLKDHIIGKLQPTDMRCDTFNPLADDSEVSFEKAATHFSLLHFAVILMLTVTVILSIMLFISLRNRGFLYRKLGKPTNIYGGGENVLYTRTTVDK